MSTDYSAISEGAGNGPYGYGEGFNGSVFGGDPGSGAIAGGGGAQPPVSVVGGGMSPGQGVPGPRGAVGARPAAAQQSLKPMLSQLLGLSPSPGMQPHGPRRPGPGHVQPPILQRGPGMGFGPRPILGGPRPLPRPVPQPAPGGGTITGGRGGAPVSGPAQRGRLQPGPRRPGQLSG